MLTRAERQEEYQAFTECKVRLSFQAALGLRLTQLV
jgi:hypothetical protein